MTLRLDVYDRSNTTLQGSLTRDQNVRINPRLGSTGTLTFSVPAHATADLALLAERNVIRIHDIDRAVDLPEAFLVDEDTAGQDRREPSEKDRPTVVGFTCPSLDAWLGTPNKGGIVLYPRGGTAGRQRDPRPFGWQSDEYDDTSWGSAVAVAPSQFDDRPAGWEDADADWIWSRPLDGGTHPSGVSYFRREVAHSGLVRVSFTAANFGSLWIDTDLALATDRDNRFAYKTFQYLDVDLDGATTFAVRCRNRSGPAGIRLSVQPIDDEGEPVGDPILRSDTSWKALDYPGSVPGLTPGFLGDIILSEAAARATAAGVLGPASWLSWTFTGTLDSDGQAWDKELSHQWRVGSKGGWMLDQLTQWAADGWVDETGELQLVNLRGSDLSASVTLHTLTDVTHDREGMVSTSLLYLSSNDMAEKAVVSALGRWEDAVTFGTSDEIDALEPMVSSLLDELAQSRDVSTVALSQSSPRPGEDFWLGDVVSYPGRSGTSTGRVTELVATVDDGTGRVDWQVTLDLEDGQFSRTRARRLRDQLRETFDQTAGGRVRLAHPKAGPGAVGGQSPAVAGEGGGQPVTILLDAADIEVPPGTLVETYVEFDVIVDDGGRERKLVLDTTVPADVVEWPIGGTVQLYLEGEWLDYNGPSRVAVNIEGIPTWPREEQARSPNVDGGEGLYPSFGPVVSEGIPIAAGERLRVVVQQFSDSTQFLKRLRFGAHQLESMGAAQFTVGGLPPFDPQTERIVHAAQDAFSLNTKVYDQAGTQLDALSRPPGHTYSGFRLDRVGDRLYALDSDDQIVSFRINDIENEGWQVDYQIPDVSLSTSTQSGVRRITGGRLLCSVGIGGGEWLLMVWNPATGEEEWRMTFDTSTYGAITDRFPEVVGNQVRWTANISGNGRLSGAVIGDSSPGVVSLYPGNSLSGLVWIRDNLFLCQLDSTVVCIDSSGNLANFGDLPYSGGAALFLSRKRREVFANDWKMDVNSGAITAIEWEEDGTGTGSLSSSRARMNESETRIYQAVRTGSSPVFQFRDMAYDIDTQELLWQDTAGPVGAQGGGWAGSP